MQKMISNAVANWTNAMDDETNKEMVKFLAQLADYNVHMLPTKKTIDDIMGYIYKNDQDIIIESLYELRYYLLVGEISDEDLNSISQVNNPLSESILFTVDLRKSMAVDDSYKNDILYALIYTIRVNINIAISTLKGGNE